jgi:hypothetical protein
VIGSLVGGAVLGAGCAVAWQGTVHHFDVVCAAVNAQNPESYCNLGLLFWAPATAAIAMVAVGLLTWLGLLVAGVRPRAMAVTVMVLLTLVAAVAFALLHGVVWLALVAPPLLLGVGMYCVSGSRRR